jgi:hypothetical protein
MIDDLEEILSNYDPAGFFSDDLITKWREESAASTAAALKLCPQHIKDWLIDCTAGDGDEARSVQEMADDDVEWFEVGHNASHYFSFGIRSDGVFIKKTSGLEYDKDCRCWYARTTVRIITLDEIPKNYWGHL